MSVRATIALALVLVSSPSAHAQVDNRAAFSVERFTPSPGAGGFLVATGAAVHERGAWSFSAWGSLMHEPLVLEDIISGERVSEPVRTRLGYELAAALGVTDRIELAIAMPMVAAQDGDRLRGIDLDETSLAPIAFGDLRFHGKIRLTPRGPGLGVALAASATLPTGDHEHFAGEAGPTLAWALVVGYRGRLWRAAANLGPRFRSERVVLLSPANPHGGELQTAVSGEVQVPWRPSVSLLGEYVAVRGDAADANARSRGPSPSEARFGLRLSRRDGWSLTTSGGVGTSPAEVGSPTWRVVVGARYERAVRYRRVRRR